MTSLPAPLRSDDQRLWVACTAAALFHLALLFGLHLDRERPAPLTLEVTLVATPNSRIPLNAQVLAPVTQSGGGENRELRSAPVQAGGALEWPGLRQAADFALQISGTPAKSVEVLTADTAPETTASDYEAAQTAAEPRMQLLRHAQAGDNANHSEPHPVRQAASDLGPALSPGLNTRASLQAAYRELWRQRVEHAGSANFPWSALTTGQPKSLTLLVTLRADGTVLQTRVLRSSGLSSLDQAALNILRMAGPFPAFPDDLRQETTELSFIYDWEFLPGNRAALRVGR